MEISEKILKNPKKSLIWTNNYLIMIEETRMKSWLWPLTNCIVLLGIGVWLVFFATLHQAVIAVFLVQCVICDVIHNVKDVVTKPRRDYACLYQDCPSHYNEQIVSGYSSEGEKPT